MYRVDEEQETIALILEMTGKGESLWGICRALEAAGIARKKGSMAWHPEA